MHPGNSSLVSLLTKYNRPGPRYTSYPPATFFEEFSDCAPLLQQIKDSNQQGDSISLYLHIPFCAKLCTFCGCHTSPMKKEAFIRRYIDALKIELTNGAALLDTSRAVTQIHWGGGTPNSINFAYIAEVMTLINELFTLAPQAEIAMECNPAHLERASIASLSAMGFNRLSLGIQDFDPQVLANINRDPSLEPVDALIAEMKRLHFTGINIDLVYGLPGQTVESFGAAVEQAIACDPDRIVTFSYAHVPWVKSAQKILEEKGLPQGQLKLAMFEKAHTILTARGYYSIGLDHYVKKDDELYHALKNKELRRNFQGYCSAKTTGQVYGFGCSSITQLQGGYIQNQRSDRHYVEAIETEGFAYSRGYGVTREQQIVRTAIQSLMCNGLLNFNELARDYQLSVEALCTLLHFDTSKLDTFIADGLVLFDGSVVTVTERGFFVVRNIAMAFDPLLSDTEHHYSQTL